MRTVINDRSRDEQIGKWVGEKVEPKWADGDIAIGSEKDGALVAGVLMNSWNGANIHAHLRCDSPYGMTREFLREVFRTVFNQLGAQRMTAACCSANKRILVVLSKMGFTCEAILKNFLPDGHLVVMVMWPENCKYLENQNG